MKLNTLIGSISQEVCASEFMKGYIYLKKNDKLQKMTIKLGYDLGMMKDVIINGEEPKKPRANVL